MKKLILLLMVLCALISPASATDWDIQVSDEVVNGVANYESWDDTAIEGFLSGQSSHEPYGYDDNVGTHTIQFPPEHFRNDFSQYGNFYSAEIYVSPVNVNDSYTSYNVSSMYDIPICVLDSEGYVLASGWSHFLSEDIGSSSRVGLNVYLEYFVLKNPEDTPSGWADYDIKYSSPSYNSSSGKYEYSESEHVSNVNRIQSKYSHVDYHRMKYKQDGDSYYVEYEKNEGVYGDYPNPIPVPSFTYGGESTIYPAGWDRIEGRSYYAMKKACALRDYKTDIHYYQTRTVDYVYQARTDTSFGDFRFMGSGSMSGTIITLKDSSDSEIYTWDSPDTAQWYNYTLNREDGVFLEIDFPDGNPSFYQYTLDGDSSDAQVYYYLDVANPTVEQFESTMASISIGDPDNEYDAIYWFKDGTLYDRYKLEDSTWYRYVNNTWTSTVESDALNNNVAFGDAGDHTVSAKIFYEGDLKASLDENIEVTGSYSAGELEVYALTPDNALIEDAQATIEDLTNDETVYSDELIGDGLKFELDRYNDYSITVSADGYSNYTEQFSFLEDRTLHAYLSSSSVSGDTVTVTFQVKDESTLEPISDVLCTFNGTSKHADSSGKVSYDVAKNTTNTYFISADGYFSESDSVSVTTSNKFITIEMTSSGGGGGGDGDGSGPTEEDGWTDDEIIAMLRAYVPPLFVLILFKYFMVVMGA